MILPVYLSSKVGSLSGVGVVSQSIVVRTKKKMKSYLQMTQRDHFQKLHEIKKKINK